MKNLILINGALEEEDSHESLLKNRAFRYGDGLFETIRVYNGIPLFSKLHHERIAEGLNLLKIESEDGNDFNLFEDNLYKIIKANNICNGGRIRYSISRLSDGFYRPVGGKSISIIEGQSIENDLYNLNERGLLVKLYKEILKPINILSPYKNAFSLIHVMAGLSCPDINNEIILLNDQKFICEGVSSNIFIFKNNILHTPALNQGCVRGVMRTIIIKYLSESLNIEVVEREIEHDFLLNADEIFFTNVIQGIRWVMGYEKKRYYNTFSKLLNQRLNEFIKVILKIN